MQLIEYQSLIKYFKFLLLEPIFQLVIAKS